MTLLAHHTWLSCLKEPCCNVEPLQYSHQAPTVLDWSLKEESGSSFSMRIRLTPGPSERSMWQGADMDIWWVVFIVCDDDIIEVWIWCMKNNLNVVTSSLFEGILGTAFPLVMVGWRSASQASEKHPSKISDWKQGSSFVVTHETSWNRVSHLASK